MRILLTGGSGRLGRAFQTAAATKHTVIAPSHAELDLNDPAALRQAARRHDVEAVLHAAAYTDVDGCERDPARATAHNATAAGAIAQGAADAGAHLVLVSTDYVFDGGTGRYREDAEVNPISHYGRSKLEGERLAAATGTKLAIARTSMVFGAAHKGDFVRFVADSARKGGPVKVVDQRGSPTHCTDLARQVLALIERQATGIWNTAGGTVATRADVAQAVMQLQGTPAPMQTVTPDSLGWIAPRPHDSSLDVHKISALVRPWGLDEALSAKLA